MHTHFILTLRCRVKFPTQTLQLTLWEGKKRMGTERKRIMEMIDQRLTMMDQIVIFPFSSLHFFREISRLHSISPIVLVSDSSTHQDQLVTCLAKSHVVRKATHPINSSTTVGFQIEPLAELLSVLAALDFGKGFPRRFV